MNGLVKRDGGHGAEWMFRYNGKLYVFKDKKAAQIAYDELVRGSLF